LPPPTPHHTPHTGPPTPNQQGQETRRTRRDTTLTATHYKDARVHYPDLKQQPHTTRPAHTQQTGPPGREPETKQIETGPETDVSEPQQCAPTPSPSRPAIRPDHAHRRNQTTPPTPNHLLNRRDTQGIQGEESMDSTNEHHQCRPDER